MNHVYIELKPVNVRSVLPGYLTIFLVFSLCPPSLPHTYIQKHVA